MTKELITGEYKKADGESTVDFLSQLIKKSPAQKIIIFGMVRLRNVESRYKTLHNEVESSYLRAFG
jgi:hypothetical protein